jgi:hypothetical protein
MAGAVAPSGDFGGEAGAATSVPPVQTQSPEAAHAALTQANTFGSIQGYPMVNNQNVYQKLRAMGHGLYADKMEANQRANDTAALANHAEALKNQASATDQLAQIATPFVSTLRDPDSTPAQKSESYRNFRNAALQLTGPSGGKMLTESQLPADYTTEGPGNMGAASSWAPYLVDSNQKAQQIAGEQIAHTKALQEVTAGNVTAGEKMRTNALTLGSTSNNDQDISTAVMALRREGAKPQDIANNFSGFLVRNPDGTPMYAQDGFPLVRFSEQAKAQAQDALVAPQQKPEYQQKMLGQIGQQLATAFNQGAPTGAGPIDLSAYNAAKADAETNHSFAKGIFPVTPQSGDDITRAALTANQATVAGQRDTKLEQGQQNADTHTMMAGIAADRAATAADRAANNQSGVRQDLAAKNKADAAEIQAWGLNRKYNIAASTPDGQQFGDPKTGTMRTMNSTVREEMKVNADTSRQAALDAHGQSDELQAKQGWGKYAPGAKPAAPAAAAPSGQPSASAAPSGQTPPSKIDVDKLQAWANQKPQARAFNRTTGAVMEWNGKAWVSAQVQ